MTSAQSQLHDWADVILADFQTVISYYLQNISTMFFCAAEGMLRTIIMQIFRLIQAFFLAKSSRFKSADFASVMTDDVGCSGRHQCIQCAHHDDVVCLVNVYWILLTHWGRVMHICFSKRCHQWRQAIIWTNDDLLSIGLLGTNFINCNRHSKFFY